MSKRKFKEETSTEIDTLRQAPILDGILSAFDKAEDILHFLATCKELYQANIDNFKPMKNCMLTTGQSYRAIVAYREENPFLIKYLENVELVYIPAHSKCKYARYWQAVTIKWKLFADCRERIKYCQCGHCRRYCGYCDWYKMDVRLRYGTIII